MDLASNLTQLQKRIESACARSGRSPDELLVMAVTKYQPPERIREAADLGIRWLGENRVQEAKAKIEDCPGGLHWHMIGHLQSNKARDAVQLFEMIQSVDSLHLAREINKAAERLGKSMPVLIQVNVAGEASKFGYAPETFLEELSTVNSLPHIEIHGLMTIAPWTAASERARPAFKRLRELKLAAEERLQAPLRHLSMGMSEDFEVAIEEGATLLRIGGSLFGPRHPR